MWIYVGTYTKKTSRGIYGVELDAATGHLGEPRLLAEVSNPSFLAMNTLGDRLYAACEPGRLDGQKCGAVAAFRIDRGTRGLTPINTRASGNGANCHVALSPDGKWLTSADYGDAVISLLPLRADGEIEPEAGRVCHTGSGPVAGRQASAHAHCATPDPSGRYVLACDLGTDEIYVYRLEPGLPRQSVLKVPPGTGPRHVAFGPERRCVYAINELDNSVDVLDWNADAGTLHARQRVSTLPTGFKGASTAGEIVVHPSGEFVYASNRGCEMIACFHVDRGAGTLEPAGHTDVGGKGCRHFAIDPTGRFLIAANEQSDNVVAFKVHHQTGALSPVGSSIPISQPTCVIFGLL